MELDNLERCCQTVYLTPFNCLKCTLKVPDCGIRQLYQCRGI